ncbi:MAG: DNA-protecting protein DprA [Patescibacteria group bacterium]
MKILHFRGVDPNSINKKSIAVVGSRQMTRYGRDVVDKFVCDFVANGVTTISGFMYGVDTEVAKKTLEYGGKHIAIFGCGLDHIYPPENKKLYEEILKSGGSIVSEYEDSAKPSIWKFPQRNKIVASLASLGVLVIEAGSGSGSLVTAKIAKKMGKKVWAVPGPINSRVSVGCNELIKSGDAQMAICVRDIIKIKTTEIQNSRIPDNLNTEEQKIFKILQLEPMEIDEIAQKLEENVVEVGSTLSIMGIKGLVTESGGKYFLVR